MTLHVCISGIDGSGKSTVTAALPHIIAAELKVRAGSAGETFRIVDPDEDLLAPGFHPNSLPITGHLSKWFKRLAKRYVDNRGLYPLVKLIQMAFQDSAAFKLGEYYKPAVIVSDGNLLLSAMGRAANYVSPASDRSKTTKETSDDNDMKAVFAYLIDGKPPRDVDRSTPSRLKKAKKALWLARLTGLRAGWLPDVVIFLDIASEAAMARIAARGQKVDRHENVDDLAQARAGYLKTVEAFGQYRSQSVANRIEITDQTPGETLQSIIDLLRPHIMARKVVARTREIPLGTTSVKLTGSALRAKLLDRRYIFRYLMANWFKGAWRELTFLFSKSGYILRTEGYSAGVMRVIYDQDDKRYGLFDRIFLNYPLHRAVYDRLHNLTRVIEPELEKRLAAGRDIRIFSAPSGFSYDLFRPLEAICARNPKAMEHIRLVAADLDPHELLAVELTKRANKIGIRFEFLKGDITECQMQARSALSAPYDVFYLSASLAGYPSQIYCVTWGGSASKYGTMAYLSQTVLHRHITPCRVASSDTKLTTIHQTFTGC
ncbi:MAG: hypothetical protein HY662_03070 [Chloroflexi bacterium]|nr:hypothetical protein [Chloroflexota bacterium]